MAKGVQKNYFDVVYFEVFPSLLTMIYFICSSVKSTIDRYKKACSDSTNTGSVSEANAQVRLQLILYLF